MASGQGSSCQWTDPCPNHQHDKGEEKHAGGSSDDVPPPSPPSIALSSISSQSAFFGQPEAEVPVTKYQWWRNRRVSASQLLDAAAEPSIRNWWRQGQIGHPPFFGLGFFNLLDATLVRLGVDKFHLVYSL